MIPARSSASPTGTDGDTLTLLKGRIQVRVRLHGIDAPETGQDFGSRAKQAASDLVFGQTVTVHPHEIDRYGRTVADVILPNGRSLNREMVGQGMAWWYRAYAAYDAPLASLEARAKGARRGLWSQPDPVPPWAWRRGGPRLLGQLLIWAMPSRGAMGQRLRCPAFA